MDVAQRANSCVSRRRLWLLAPLLAVVCLIAGCGGAASAVVPAGTAISTTTPIPAPTMTPPKKASARVPILMYHHISDNSRWPGDDRMKRLTVPPDQFAEQLAYLQRAGYATITLDDLVAALTSGAALPDKPVILTFDDGYKDFYANAFPLLRRYGDRATIYVISARVGQPDYMTWDDLRDLAASPLITVGSHTRKHPHLANHTDERVRTELEGGKADLEAQLHTPVRHLAYPDGSYNATTIKLAREAGYATAVTVHYGVKDRADKLLELPRVFVNGGTPLDDLIAGLEGRR